MRKLTLLLSWVIFLTLPNHTHPQPLPAVQVYLFYIENCESCGGVQSYLSTLQSLYPSLEVKTFDVGDPAHYEILINLEKQFGSSGNELPVAFIGNHVLAGEREIMEKLNPLILEYQLKGGIPLPFIEIGSSAKPSDKVFSVELVYFYQKGCSKCSRANNMLKYLSKKYPRLVIKEIDMSTPDGKRLNETFSNRLNLPIEKRLTAPSIFIGQAYLLPSEITEPRIEALIQKYERGEPPSPLRVESGDMKRAEESMITRFKSLGVLTVLSAGLIDGLNPCAFGTMIFFISYLTFVGRKKGEIFRVGLGFSGAIFATYLLIGFGMLSFIQYFSFMPLLSRIVYFITFVIVFAFGSYSLFDYVQLKRGHPSGMKLQLPDFLKKRIHRVIREQSRTRHYLFAAVVAGFVISLLEFTCTGQVYLPTILFVTHIPPFRTSAISYVILYNVMFIIPLLIIFGAATWGVTSEQFSFFLQKRVSTIKLFTSLLFFTLAGLLLIGFF